MNQSQEMRRDEALVDVGGVVIRLRVVAVDFADRTQLDVPFQEALPVPVTRWDRSFVVCRAIL